MLNSYAVKFKEVAHKIDMKGATPETFFCWVYEVGNPHMRRSGRFGPFKFHKKKSVVSQGCGVKASLSYAKLDFHQGMVTFE